MRFVDVDGELTLQARLKDGWQHIYRVIPHPRYDSEYEITNWYTATHPETPYQSNIIVAKPGPSRSRITMYNARVTIRDADGRAEKRWLADEHEFKDVLCGEFGLNMSDQEIEDWLRGVVASDNHETGSCSMLPKELGGVVDTALKVYGTSNVRVIGLFTPMLMLDLL